MEMLQARKCKKCGKKFMTVLLETKGTTVYNCPHCGEENEYENNYE